MFHVSYTTTESMSNDLFVTTICLVKLCV